MKSNLSHTPPTAEEMMLWHKGQFPLGDRHDELQAFFSNDPFLKEAMEGLMLDPDLSGFKPHVTKSPSHKSHFKGWVLGLVIGIGCALLTVSLWNPFAPENTTSPAATSQNQKTTSHHVADPVQPIQEKGLEQKQLSTSPVAKTQEQVSTTTDIESPLNLIASRVGPVAGDNHPGKSLRRINVCINLQGYEVYPYKERSNPKKFELGGTPADNGQQNEPQRSVSYLNFLEETILSFQEKDFVLTNQRCNIILEQYPNDINALYLKAKCMFNNSPSKALIYFEKTLDLNNGRLNENEIKEYIRLCQ